MNSPFWGIKKKIIPHFGELRKKLISHFGEFKKKIIVRVPPSPVRDGPNTFPYNGEGGSTPRGIPLFLFADYRIVSPAVRPPRVKAEGVQREAERGERERKAGRVTPFNKRT